MIEGGDRERARTTLVPAAGRQRLQNCKLNTSQDESAA
jgi:hypothetical protein